MTAASESHDGFALLVTHQGILSHLGYTAEDAGELEYWILEDLFFEFGADIVSSSSGYFPQEVRYSEILVELGHEFGVMRVFSKRDDVYIICVFINDNDSSFFDSFFEHVVID